MTIDINGMAHVILTVSRFEVAGDQVLIAAISGSTPMIAITRFML